MKKRYLLFVFLISIAITSTYELVISLDNYDGLRPGSKVVYNEENIGKVKRIFEEEGEYIVVLKIYQEYEIKKGSFLFKVDKNSTFPSILVEKNNPEEVENFSSLENQKKTSSKVETIEQDEIEEKERLAWIKAKEEAKLEAERLEEEERKKWEAKKKQEEWEKKRKEAADKSPYKGDIESIKIFQLSNNLNADGFWGKKSQAIYDSLLIVKAKQKKVEQLKKQQEAINNANKGDAALSLEKEYLALLKKKKKDRIEDLKNKLSEEIKNKNLYNDKDQFETSADFFIRATNSTLDYYDSLEIVIHNYFNNQIRPIEKEFENVLDKNFSSKEIDISLGDYDADLEIFPIEVKDLKNNISYNRKISIKKKRAKKLYNNWNNVKAVGLFSLTFNGSVYLNKVYIVDELNGLEYSFLINEKEIPSIVTAKSFDLDFCKNILMLRKPESPEILSYSEIEDPYLGIGISLKDNMITYFTEVDTEDSSFTGDDYDMKGTQTRLNINGKVTLVTTARPKTGYYGKFISFDPVLTAMRNYNNNNKEHENYSINKKALNILSYNSLSQIAVAHPELSIRISNLETVADNYLKYGSYQLFVNNYNNSIKDASLRHVDCSFSDCKGVKNFISNYLNNPNEKIKYFYVDKSDDLWLIFQKSSGSYYRKELNPYDSGRGYDPYDYNYSVDLEIDKNIFKIILNRNNYFSLIAPSSDGITIAFPFLFDLDYSTYNLSSQKVSELRKNFENEKTEELKKMQGESSIKESTDWGSNEFIYKGKVGDNAFIDYRELKGNYYKVNENIKGTDVIVLSFSTDSLVLKHPNGVLKTFYLESYTKKTAHYDVPPSAKKTLKARYPDLCKTAGIEGRVVIVFYVDKKGKIDKSSIKVLNSVPCLDQVCIDAIKNSKWNPAKKGNDNVGTYLTKTFTFSLEEAN